MRRDFGWAVVLEQFTALCERVAQVDGRVEQHGRRIKAFALSHSSSQASLRTIRSPSFATFMIFMAVRAASAAQPVLD